MTDIMKLAQEYAVRYRVNRAVDEARAALQSVIEALQSDRDQLQRDFTYMKQQRDALQSQLDTMGKGEPMAQVDPVPLYRAAINCPHEIDHEQVILKYDPKQPGHNALNQLGRRLVAAVAAPKALAPLTDEQMRDAFAQALTDVYVCTRVWSAWSCGTMTEDDFSPASECDEVLDSLVQAAHGIGGTP